VQDEIAAAIVDKLRIELAPQEQALAVRDKAPTQNVEAYDNVEVSRLAKALARTLDPQVRLSLASNMSCPKPVLRSLASDADPMVCREARARLEND
jgi:hypothetical protein